MQRSAFGLPTAGRVSVCGKNFNVAISSVTINTINVKMFRMVVLKKLY